MNIDAEYGYPGEHDPVLHDPVFVGHYWLNEKNPKPLSDNCACLDYNIAKAGKLVAYRWRGEHKLEESNFVWCK